MSNQLPSSTQQERRFGGWQHRAGAALAGAALVLTAACDTTIEGNPRPHQVDSLDPRYEALFTKVGKTAACLLTNPRSLAREDEDSWYDNIDAVYGNDLRPGTADDGPQALVMVGARYGTVYELSISNKTNPYESIVLKGEVPPNSPFAVAASVTKETISSGLETIDTRTSTLIVGHDQKGKSVLKVMDSRVYWRDRSAASSGAPTLVQGSGWPGIEADFAKRLETLKSQSGIGNC